MNRDPQQPPQIPALTGRETLLPEQPERRQWLGRMAGRGAAAIAVGMGAGAGLLGCDWQPNRDHAGPAAPHSGPILPRPRIAWVLSSGGPRGFVHVGALKALHDMGLVPDVIVGASVGALVGVLHAGGVRGAALERLAMNLAPWAVVDLALGGDAHFSGAGLANWVRDQLPADRLEQLALPTVCVARRLDLPAEGAAKAAGPDAGAFDRQPLLSGVVALSRGDAGLAVQAATAIEGRFTPVRIRGQRLADADLVMPLPVRLARALGADRVLAIDASAHEDKAPPGTEAWRAADLRKRALTEPDARLADVLLHPDSGYYAGLSDGYRERCIRIGEATTRQAESAIRALHGAT